MSTAEELERLVALRDRGVLSEEEFQAEKARVLGQSSTAATSTEPTSELPSPGEAMSAPPSASSEEPTSPGFVASPSGPPVPPTGSPAPTGGDDGGHQRGFVLTGKKVLISLLILVLIGAGVGLGIVLTGSSKANASEVFLQPANAQGQNPFTPNVGKDATVPKTVSGALTPSSGTSLASYSGNTVGLYGGTLDLSTCNADQMITYLEANPAKASAWAGAEGISISQIPSYIGGLTPMTLRYDTRVTNHGYVDGHANAIPEILQAGQAVLVDSYGVPRARCYCGNPLTPPVAVSGSPRYAGSQWSGFSPTTVIVVQQSTTIINNFTLIDNATGQAFSRPAGTTGSSDTPAPTCGGPSMPGVTACTNPTTTAPTTTVPPTTAPPTTTTTVPPTTSTTAPAAPATSGVIPDGTYVIAQDPACGNVPIDGLPLIVQGDTATMQPDPQGSQLQGTITYQSGGFEIHISDGTSLDIKLDGTVVDRGVLNGSGETGGVNPSGQTGWVCDFQWTGNLSSSGTAPSSSSGTAPSSSSGTAPSSSDTAPSSSSDTGSGGQDNSGSSG
jgi:hypothetical protein